MRITCYGCGKPASNEVPEDTIVRAVCFCPECIEQGNDGTKDARAEGRREALDDAWDAPLEGRSWRNQEVRFRFPGLRGGRSLH